MVADNDVIVSDSGITLHRRMRKLEKAGRKLVVEVLQTEADKTSHFAAWWSGNLRSYVVVHIKPAVTSFLAQ